MEAKIFFDTRYKNNNSKIQKYQFRNLDFTNFHFKGLPGCVNIKLLIIFLFPGYQFFGQITLVGLSFNFVLIKAAHQQKLELDIINFFDFINVKKSLKLLSLKYFLSE